MAQYIQKDDIQAKVSLENIGGVDWYDFPQIDSETPTFEVLKVGEELMNVSYWIWKTAVLLSNNDLDCLYRPSTDSHYLIAEFTLNTGTQTVVQLGNISWSNISNSGTVGFYEIGSDDEIIEAPE